MSDQNYQNEDEIDLFELIASLWAHILLVFFFTGIFIFLSSLYYLNAQKKYTATAVFQIQQSNSNQFNLNGEIGALASFAGFSSSLGSGTGLLLERIKSREFILQAVRHLSLSEDPFYNTFNKNAEDPAWKAITKNLIGWRSLDLDKELLAQEVLIKNFSSSIKASSTGAGAIKISVTHISPISAAKYANDLLEKIRSLIKSDDDTSKSFRLSYLAETLADALQEMEKAQNNLKEYALQNSTAARENFITGSMKLDNLRLEKREADQFMNVLKHLRELVRTGNLTSEKYEALRISFPIIDDVNFRRILGMSETISAWKWPSLDTIKQVNDTLKDRSRRLDVEIADNEKNAKQYASSAEKLAKLTRDVKIAEATFTVLTEQVKSQTLAAGYNPDTFQVFSYASPPPIPSSPKRNLILGLGAFLGLIVGCAISLINAARRGVYYTRQAIISDSKPAVALKSNNFQRIAHTKSTGLLSAINRQELNELEEAEVSLADKKLVYFLDTGGRLTASQTARLLATKSCQSGRNIIICDVSTQPNRELKEKPKKVVSGITVVEADGGYDTMVGGSEASFFTSSKFKLQVETLLNSYDQVYISSDRSKSFSGLIALKIFNPSLVLMSCLRKTEKAFIKKTVSMHDINILFHD